MRARWGHRLAAAAQEGLRRGVDALYPPGCLVCAAPTGAAGGLCADCWRDTPLIAPPICDRCGRGLDLAPADGLGLCEDCAAHPPRWERGRAATRYAGPARALTLALKHGDRTEAAPSMGRWMAQAGRALLEDAPLIAPAPLHWRRRAARRFNQASLLARAVAAATSAPLALDLLRRTQPTPSQSGLGRAARAANVAGAFAVGARHRGALDGRRVVLIDDVLTTGATLEACAAALHAEGARVDILVFSRVDPESSPEEGA